MGDRGFTGASAPIAPLGATALPTTLFYSFTKFSTLPHKYGEKSFVKYEEWGEHTCFSMSRRLLRMSSVWRTEKTAAGRASGASPAGVPAAGEPRLLRTAAPGNCPIVLVQMPALLLLSFATDSSVTTSVMMLILQRTKLILCICTVFSFRVP